MINEPDPQLLTISPQPAGCLSTVTARPRVKRKTYNNELMNIDHGLEPAVLPEAEVDEDTPFTGTLAFRCESAQHLAAVEHFLTARRASALMGFKAGRVYLKAAAPIEKSGEFPQRLAIPVEFIDEPGPAIAG